MKKFKLTTATWIQASLMVCILLFTSCDYNQKAGDTKEIAEGRNDAKFDNNEKEEDAQFLVNAAEINLEEIQLGKLAQQKGTTVHVKELGKMMEDAHSKSQRDLIALAESKQISIPSSATNDAKDVYMKLKKKSGDDFDEAYADKMVNGHQDAIAAFENASTECNDKEIKNWAIATLPDLRKHLNHSLESQKKFDKNNSIF